MCEKTRFTSRALALQRLAEIQARGENRGNKPVRAYAYKECGGFHLTSLKLDQKQQKKIKKINMNNIRKEADEWLRKKGWKNDDH